MRFKKLIVYVSILFIVNVTGIRVLHAQYYKLNLAGIFIPERISNDSAIVMLKALEADAILAQDSVKRVRCLIALSSMHRASLKFSDAFDYAGEAIVRAEECSDWVLQAEAHKEFGLLNYMFKQDEIAYRHFDRSDALYKMAYDHNLIAAKDLFHIKYYQLLKFRRKRRMDTVKLYVDTCMALLDTAGVDKLNRICVNRERASLIVQDGKVKKASRILLDGIKTLQQIRPKTRAEQQHKDFILILYASLGQIHWVSGDTEMALFYFKKSIASVGRANEMIFHTSSSYHKYAMLLYAQGRYKEAFDNLKKAKAINDKFENTRRRSNAGFISVKNPYNAEIQRKSDEIVQKNLELAQNHQKLLRLRSLLIGVLFLMILAAIVIRYRMQILKHRRKLQDSEELLLHKNKELTSNMLQLIEKEEQIKALGEIIQQGKGDKASKSLLASLEKRSESLWESFNKRFMEVNGDFYEHLQKKYPNLSVAELKLCALIKLNFTGKEMAHLLGISAGSVNVARHRLRKKLNIEKNESLISFINRI